METTKIIPSHPAITVRRRTEDRSASGFPNRKRVDFIVGGRLVQRVSPKDAAWMLKAPAVLDGML